MSFGDMPIWAAKRLPTAWESFKQKHEGRSVFAKLVFKEGMQIPSAATREGNPRSYILDLVDASHPPTGADHNSIPFSIMMRSVWNETWQRALWE